MSKRKGQLERAIEQLELEREAANRRAVSERAVFDLAIGQLKAQIRPPRAKKPVVSVNRPVEG